MKFDLIYADPAGTFKVYSDKGKDRSAENHYGVMTLKDMCGLPVASLAEDNAILVMWATYPNLPEALILGAAWGFTYKTVAFTWVKQNKVAETDFVGLGYYTRANPEIALLFRRGDGLKRKHRGVRNLIMSKIREHSRKPDEARERLEKLFGDVSRIELFARTAHPGWTCLGDGIDGRDLRQSIPETAHLTEPDNQSSIDIPFRLGRGRVRL